MSPSVAPSTDLGRAVTPEAPRPRFRRSLPGRALGIAVLALFCLAPLMNGCTGRSLTTRYGKRVAAHLLDNPLDAFDSAKSASAKREAVNTMRDRGVFLLLIAIPVAAGALLLAPRRRVPRVAPIAALVGAAALGAFCTCTGRGVSTWDPAARSEDERVLRWLLWASPSALPLVALLFAVVAIAKRRATARRTARAVAVLAVVGAAIEVGSSHRGDWGGWAMALAFALAVWVETRDLEAPAPTRPRLRVAAFLVLVLGVAGWGATALVASVNRAASGEPVVAKRTGATRHADGSWTLRLTLESVGPIDSLALRDLAVIDSARRPIAAAHLASPIPPVPISGAVALEVRTDPVTLERPVVAFAVDLASRSLVVTGDRQEIALVGERPAGAVLGADGHRDWSGARLRLVEAAPVGSAARVVLELSSPKPSVTPRIPGGAFVHSASGKPEGRFPAQVVATDPPSATYRVTILATTAGVEEPVLRVPLTVSEAAGEVTFTTTTTVDVPLGSTPR